MRRVAVIALFACGGAAGSGTRTFIEQPLATAPGLSGLAVDERGEVWTVAERARTAYRISPANAVEGFAITNVPDGHDLEAIAALGDGFAFGTEGKAAEPSRILLARRDGRR